MIRNREIKGFLDRGPARAGRGFTARTQHARTRRHPVCGPRSRQGDRHRLSHRAERSHRQSRSAGLDDREALRGDPPAMSDLRQQETAEPAPRAGADRARPRRQAGHDQRRIPDRVVAGHGGALPQACEPPHRRGHAARADRSRSADEHQLSTRRTISRRRPRMSIELRAGLSGGSFGKGSTAEQAEASALMEAIERYSGIFQGDEIRVTRRFTDFAPGDAIPPNDVLLFSDAQYRRRRADAGRSRARHRPRRSRSIHRPRSSGRRSGRCATDASNIFRPACCISSTAVRPPSRRIPTAARPATRSRKPSSRDSSNWWSAMPTRSGGTIDRSEPEVDLSQFDDSYVRDLQSPARRRRTQAMGARRHQRSRRSDLCRDLALDAKRTGKYRVRLRRAFRQAHRVAAHA